MRPPVPIVVKQETIKRVYSSPYTPSIFASISDTQRTLKRPPPYTTKTPHALSIVSSSVVSPLSPILPRIHSCTSSACALIILPSPDTPLCSTCPKRFLATRRLRSGSRQQTWSSPT